MAALTVLSSRPTVTLSTSFKPSRMNRISTLKSAATRPLQEITSRLYIVPCGPRRFSGRGMRAMASGSDEKPESDQTTTVEKQGQGNQVGINHRRGRHGVALHRSPMNAMLDIWDPLFPTRDLKQMIQSVDRVFEGLMPAAVESNWPTWKMSSTPRLSWDVRETEEFFELHSDVPGLKKEDLKVFIEDGNTLVISGERKIEDSDDNWKKRRYTNYKTSFVLPENANTDAIEAELKHGVLELKIPKIQQAEKQTIKEVEVK